ncbi:MAG: hypothetical protein LBT45_02945 [Rickettsiales bacterium]|nr:hypothetical protein [Rickettsiales bacterium]
MMRKLFIGVFMLAAAPALAASMQQPTGRPSAAARAGTASLMRFPTAGLLPTASVTANDARCENPLPDQLTAGRCIQKYMACLKQDSVCGEHFESCDTKSRFNGKRIFCQDKLQECPDDGITVIYGTTVTSTSTTAVCDGETKTVARTFVPALNAIDFAYNGSSAEQSNQIAQAIYDGAQWAATNASTACMNAADGCIKRACQNSAFKCVISDALNEDKYTEIATNVVLDTGGATSQATSYRVSPSMVEQYAKNMAYTGDQARNYIKGACKTDIGTNKFCYLLANSKAPKDDSWTIDDFEVDLVYNEIMTGSMNRLAANQNKILEWMARGVGTAIDACKSTAKNCVQSACGSGSLAACYGSALDGSNAISIEQIATIGPKCTGIINADQNCLDLLVDKDEGPSAAIWEKVWGTQADGYVGAFGLVGQLNTQLAQMFNETAVKNLRKQCQNEAEACVRRECGDKFTSCYINDKWLTNNDGGASATYGTSLMNNGIANATSNSAGGFDEVMARSLCMIPVKKSETCQSFFDIQYAKSAKNGTSDSWGTSFSVGSTWNSAGADTSCTVTENYQQTVENPDETVTMQDAERQKMAKCSKQELTIFNDLIADIGQTARAQLTKEQNTLKNQCENHRNAASIGKTYIWVKKPGINDGILDNYSNDGLLSSQDPTADLWGAFCQVQVDVYSDDQKIQQLFEDSSRSTRMSAYFSLGDAIMCGSWLKQSDLDKIEAYIKVEAYEKADNERSWASQNAGLIAGLIGGVAGAVGGGFVGNKIGGMIADNREEKPEYTDDQIAAYKNALRNCREEFEKGEKIARDNKWKVDGNSNLCYFDGVKGIQGAETPIIIYNIEKGDDYEKLSVPNGDTDIKFTGSQNACVITANLNTPKRADDCSTQTGGVKGLLDAAEEALRKYEKPDAEKDKAKTKAIATGIGAGVGGLALGLGAGFMTKSIADRSFEVEKLKAGDAAVAAWFNIVGSKIKCKVGGKTVGSYGDVVELK